MAAPVLELQPHAGNRFGDVYAGNAALEFCCRAILIIPVKESLDWPCKQIGANIVLQRQSAHEQVQLAHIQTRLAIVLPGQL